MSTTTQPAALAEFTTPEISGEIARRNGHGKPDRNSEFPRLLAHLYRGGVWSYWWTASEAKDTQTGDALERLTTWHPAAGPWTSPLPVDSGPHGPRHVYFGVHPTTAIPQRTNKKTGKLINQKYVRATIADVASINCLFAEFDAKDFAGGKPAALAHVHGLGNAPSVIIDSGGGYHCYWLLADPFVIATDADRQRAKSLQYAWVDSVGSDGGAKDLARVLRVPGSKNYKPAYGPDFPTVTIIEADFARLYSIADLDMTTQAPTPAAVKRDTTAKPIALDDLAVVTRAKNAGNGAKFSALWGGSIAGYKSASEADQALCNLLAFYTRDASQIERLWLSSGLRADDPKIDRPDYRARTIAKALADVTTFYDPHYHAPAAAIDDSAPAQDWPAFDDDVTGTPAARKTKPQPPTDDELADRWKAAAPLTSYGLGDYRRYAAGIWPVISEPAIDREIKAQLIAAKSEGLRPTAARLSSVRTFARLSVHLDDQAWDADPDVLVLKNGMLHIPTRELRPHDPDARVTSGLDFDYQSYADAPMWKYALDSTVPDAAEFLQEFAGYCFTTDTRHEIALWLLGPRGCGKSTIIGGIAQTLGMRAGVLGLASIERSQFALSALPGKTLITATEQPSMYMRSVHVLNAIISGEPVTVERKHENAYTLTPHAKMLWSMNELPRVGEASSGLFRRVKVIKFPALAESDRDPDVKEAIKNERAGILNWALIGLDRLRKRGRFEIPQCVKDATAEFESTNDVPALYVADNCMVGPNFKAQAGPLYADYKRWCEDNGHKWQSSTTLAEDWQRLGFERKISAGRWYWHGIGLRAEYPLESQRA